MFLVTGCVFIWKQSSLGMEEMWFTLSQAVLGAHEDSWAPDRLPGPSPTAGRQELVPLQPSDAVCRWCG